MVSSEERLIRIAERQWGVFSRQQALACGVSESAAGRRIARGSWRRIHLGVYRVAGTPCTPESRIVAATLGAGRGSCVSHRTAGRLWQLDGIVGDTLEISVHDRRDIRIEGVRIYRPRELRRVDRTRIGVIPVTTPLRTILDLASSVPKDVLELALDDALRRRLVRLRQLVGRVDPSVSRGRRGVPSLRRLLAAREEDRSTESALETIFLQAIRNSRLPRPRSQHIVTTADGAFVARVDFAYPHSRIAIEIDGYAFHEGRRQFDSDRVRQNALVDAGWIVLRFTKTDLSERIDHVVATIYRALRRQV